MTPVRKVGQVPSKKPGSRAPMGAMARTLLGLLGLLLAPAEASEEGEVCLDWLPFPVESLLPFRCPQRPDGTDGRFCCGICIKPYCCDSEEDRLDQDQCLQAWWMLHVFVRAALAQKERPTLSVLKDLQATRPSEPTLWSLSKIELTGAVLGGTACALILFLILSLIFCKCCPRTRDSEAGLGEDSPPDSPTPQLDILDFNPRFEEKEPLVRPMQEQLSRSWAASSRGEVGWGTEEARRRAITVPNIHYSYPRTLPATQPPTTSGATSASGPTGEPAAAGEGTPVATEPPAATGGENPPVQGAAGGGKATAQGGPTGGEGATPPVPSAPGDISAA